MQDADLGKSVLRWEKDSIIGEGLEEYADRIDVKMLLNNSIPGVLPLQIRYVDNDSLYYYCVSEWIPFEQLLQENTLDFYIIQQLYLGIYEACSSCEEYFLREEHFVLDAAYIAWSPRKKRISICYFPGYRMPVGEQLKSLSERFLTQIDHQDKRCAAFLYGIYDLIMGEDYSLSKIGEYLKGYQQQEGLEIESGAARKPFVREKKPCSYLLQIVSKGSLAPEVIPLGQDSLLIGRSMENQYVIPARQISRRHARIEQEDGQVYLTDMNAANGVFLNGKRLSKKHPVLCREGDKISFADITYRLKRQGSPL